MLGLIPMGILILGVNVFIGECLNNLPIDCDMEEVFSLSTYWLVLDVIDLEIFELDAKLTVVGEKIIWFNQWNSLKHKRIIYTMITIFGPCVLSDLFSVHASTPK